MNMQELRKEHNAVMASYKIIDLFIDDNYNRGNRVEIINLARKLRQTVDKAHTALWGWVKANQNYNCSAMYRLCIFFSPQHTRPQWFGSLPLTQEERNQTGLVSRQMDLPSRAHFQCMNELILRTESFDYDNSFDYVAEQLTANREIILNALHKNSFLLDRTEPVIDLVGENVRQTVTGSNRGGNGGGNNSYSGNRGGNGGNSLYMDNLKDFSFYHSWGYLTFARLDQLRADPITAGDFLILKAKDKPDEPQVDRKLIQQHLRDFIDTATTHGLSLVQIQSSNNRDIMDPTPVPMFVFSKLNELSPTIKVVFKNLGDIGRFILDK